MSLFECEHCGGAVGLFCHCPAPSFGPAAAAQPSPAPGKEWLMAFRRVSEQLYRESQAVAASGGTSSNRIQKLKALQQEQLKLIEQLDI